ncbi:hypothetical protein GFS31_38250 [Leptolyngbya sp. BL0902]|nr:hypothetical protein GFS31_38250 [Leptolyngbya sp. BL0902]
MRNSTLFIDFIPEFNDIKKRFDEIEKYQNICTIEIESVVDRDMIGIIYDDSKKGVISNQLKIEFLNLGMCITPLGMTNSIYCLGGRTTGKMENFTIASWLLNVATSHLNEKDILEIRMQDLSRPVAFFSDRNRDKVILLMPSWLH